MRRLLRSVIDIDSVISQENLVFNFTKLMNTHIEWGRQDDDKVFNYIFQYFQTQLEMPAIQSIRDYFERIEDIETIERLKDIEASQPYIRTNFNNLLTQLLDEQNKLKAVALLKEAHEIVTRGLEIDGERKFGIRDGLMHFSARANDLIVPNMNGKFRGDVRQDAEDMKREYITAKNEKDKVWGRMCGIAEIDHTCRGGKRGELWVHAAYPGELKTTFAINWCYNLITHYKTNVLYISLEMPYEQVRRNIYALHTANTKWAQRGFKGLDYRKIRDGELTPEEEAYYFDHIIPDFNTNTNYCHFEVLNPDREMTMADIRMEAELLHKQLDVGFVVIDHGQWVEARKGKRNKEYTIELNSVVRDAKRFAMQFNHNQGIPVLLLWQINREGKDEADKNEGVYKAKALTYANEVEKTADVITTTYLNEEHRKNGTTRIANLKNRDNPQFKPFDAMVDFVSRRMYSMDKTTQNRNGMSTHDADQILGTLGDV